MDLVFKAMAQYTPGHPEQARQTLKSAAEIVQRLAPGLQKGILDRVWEKLEFDVLRREAESLINPGAEVRRLTGPKRESTPVQSKP
jgi:hypothetical protein